MLRNVIAYEESERDLAQAKKGKISFPGKENKVNFCY
jgi:hypothetical protein